MSVSIHPIMGLPMFRPGDDLAEALASRIAPQDGDVLVVAQKVVSKVEGRLVRLDSVTASAEADDLAAQTGKPAALCELILSESAEVMRVRKDLVIVRHRLGLVAANAGIDASNVGEADTVLLWPVDPDASAARLRVALEARFGVKLAVIVGDSLGRAWRVGTLGTAIGVSGMKPLRDRRGESDLFGRTLQATVTGVADEIAAAASLVIGEGDEGTPAAIVRGAVYDRDESARLADLVRPPHEDLFR
jgi:coenzyme F420-0:L-glutamate ligase/coenzyme F420-1:gamma-L-glutamate ligase